MREISAIAAQIGRTKANQRGIYEKYAKLGMLPPEVETMRRTVQRLTDEYNEASTAIGEGK